MIHIPNLIFCCFFKILFCSFILLVKEILKYLKRTIFLKIKWKTSIFIMIYKTNSLIPKCQDILTFFCLNWFVFVAKIFVALPSFTLITLLDQPKWKRNLFYNSMQYLLLGSIFLLGFLKMFTSFSVNMLVFLLLKVFRLCLCFCFVERQPFVIEAGLAYWKSFQMRTFLFLLLLCLIFPVVFFSFFIILRTL